MRLKVPEESTPSATLPKIPDAAHALLSQYLTLTDGALKRYIVDSYNAQLSLARNYMWLSFITLSGYVMLFDRCGLGLMLKDYVFVEQGSLFCLLAPLFVLKASWLSIEVLLTAVSACTGTAFKEVYENVNKQFESLETDAFLAEDLYALKRQTLTDINRRLDEALSQADRRGRLLRSMATSIRHSIYWALSGVLFFCLTYL